MTRVVEDFLLECEFAALECDFSSGGVLAEGLVHGVPYINKKE